MDTTSKSASCPEKFLPKSKTCAALSSTPRVAVPKAALDVNAELEYFQIQQSKRKHGPMWRACCSEP